MKTQIKIEIIVLIFLFIFFNTASAKLFIPHILSDNMVLQQNSSVKIWGKANPGTVVKISENWQNTNSQTTVLNDSTWEITVKTTKAGGPYSIFIMNENETIKLENILLGEVWICSGQSNMEMPVKGFKSQPVNGAINAILESENFNQIRMFSAIKTKSFTKEFDVKGSWLPASINTTGDFSAVGYFYALELFKVLKVPVGIINISWGGSNIQSWMSLDNLKMFPEFDVVQIDVNSKAPQRVPTTLYNGMFYPISKFVSTGIIWYQGEANVEEPEFYTKLFPAMVNEWRKNIGRGNIPFYYVQIAPYRYKGSEKISSALLRESQLNCLNLISNSGMAVTMDIGNELVIHPSEKKTVGSRLALIALAKKYGFDKLPFEGPILKGEEIKDNKIILTFNNMETGFMSANQPLIGFEIAGEDQMFIPAETKVINYNQLEVWSDRQTKPIYVRYAFKNYSIGNLMNSFGLPASSFRTDSIH